MDKINYTITVEVEDEKDFPINASTRRIDDEGEIYFVTKFGCVCVWSRNYSKNDNELKYIDNRYKLKKG